MSIEPLHKRARDAGLHEWRGNVDARLERAIVDIKFVKELNLDQSKLLARLGGQIDLLKWLVGGSLFTTLAIKLMEHLAK